jgi:uncharacterized membrane protein
MNFDELKNPVDVTDQFDPGDITANKGMACVACFPILFWLPLVACKDSAFGKFYANQGFITLILSFASGVLSAIIGLIPILGAILAPLVSLVLGVATIASFIFTIYNASQDRAKYIPVIGQLIEVFK